MLSPNIDSGTIALACMPALNRVELKAVNTPWIPLEHAPPFHQLLFADLLTDLLQLPVGSSGGHALMLAARRVKR